MAKSRKCARKFVLVAILREHSSGVGLVRLAGEELADDSGGQVESARPRNRLHRGDAAFCDGGAVVAKEQADALFTELA